jgi:hypothetical protein
MISQALRKHQTTIIRHLNDDRYHQKVTSENGGSVSHLSEVQTKLVIVHLREVTYFKMSDIREYIISALT